MPELRTQGCPGQTVTPVGRQPLPEMLVVTEREGDTWLGFSHQSLWLAEPNCKPLGREPWEMSFTKSALHSRHDQGKGKTWIRRQVGKGGQTAKWGRFLLHW